MAEKFDEFMEEIENDIRQEKYMNLWNRYGKIITGILSMGLIGLVGYNLMSQYNYRQRTQASDIFIGAQDYAQQQRQAEALSAFKSLAEKHVAPYTILAKINEASLLGSGTTEQQHQAIKIYQEIMGTPGVDKVWQDLAVYKKISLQLEQPSADIGSLLKEISVMNEEESPLSPLLLELKGILLFQKGEKSEAGEIFVKLAQSKKVPEGIQMRSQLMTQMISAGQS